jgi:hypothetical protein
VHIIHILNRVGDKLFRFSSDSGKAQVPSRSFRERLLVAIHSSYIHIYYTSGSGRSGNFTTKPAQLNVPITSRLEHIRQT